MLAGLMISHSRDEATMRGLEGQKFFKYGLAHYYRFGAHRPGQTSIWDEFRNSEHEPMAGIAGVGSVDDARASFEGLEEAGVDQVILLHQAANYRHEHIMESLELFGREILPEIRGRASQREKEKAEKLAPFVRAAMERIEPAPAPDPIPEVLSYPRLWAEAGENSTLHNPQRALENATVWKLHVGGGAKS